MQDNKNGAGGLDELLTTNGAAQSYFNALPDYVQDMIKQRRQRIVNEDQLHRYAESLTAGDR